MGSFQHQTLDSFTRATCIELLKPNRDYHDKAGSETWTCAFAPDESCFAWSCGNRKVVVIPWNRYKHTLMYTDNKDEENVYHRSAVTIDCGYLVWAVAFGSGTPEGRMNRSHWTRFDFSKDLILATGLNNGRIRIWDVATGKLLTELMDHKDVIRDLTFAPDGSMRLVSASRDKTLKVWDIKDDGNMFKTLYAHNKWVFSCAWSPTAELLASVGSGKMVLLWDMSKYQLFRKLEGHSNDVVSCDFSPDGALLATASWDTRVFLWDPYTGEMLRSFGHLYPPPRPIFASGANDKWVRAVAVSSDGRHMASVADDGYLRFWDMCDNTDPQEIAAVNDAVCATYSPSGKVLAVGDRNGCVSFWLSPVQVESLQHLCRRVVRRFVTTPDVKKLELPKRLQNFLQYKTWT